MTGFSSFRQQYAVKGFPFTYLDVLKEVEKCKERTLRLELPEPNFTKVLQGVKESKVCNFYSDTWIEFSEEINGVIVYFKCTTQRLPETRIRLFKGENSI